MAIGGILNQETDVTGFATKAELKQEIDKVNQSLGTLPGVPKLVGSWDYTFTYGDNKFFIFSKISKETLIDSRCFYIVSEFISDVSIETTADSSISIVVNNSAGVRVTNILSFASRRYNNTFSKHNLDISFGQKFYTSFYNSKKSYDSYTGKMIDTFAVFNDEQTLTINRFDNFNEGHIQLAADFLNRCTIPMRFSVYVIE